MTNKKVTRRALLMSVTSLLICISMLLGTTFAWFTDEVTSGVNQIVAGNLDVELYHKNSDVNEAEKVTATTQLFNSAIESSNYELWEPGAVAYEVFTVSNVGTLALKYKLNAILANITGDNNTSIKYNTVVDAEGNDTTYSLLDVLRVVEIDGDKAPSVRPSYTKNDGVLLKNYLADDHYSTSALEPGTSKNVTIVIFWPEGADDNTWNLKNGKYASDSSAENVGKLKVGLAISLIATQQTSEADSFGIDYDDSADTVAGDFANAVVSSATTSAAVTAENNTLSTVLTVPVTPSEEVGVTTVTVSSTDSGALTDATSASLEVETSNVVASTNSYTVQNTGSSAAAVIDLSLYVTKTVTDTQTSTTTSTTVQATEGFTAVVETYIAKELSGVTVRYNGSDTTAAFGSAVSATAITSDTVPEGAEVGKAYYNANTGYLAFITDHFSEYVVDTTSVAYLSSTDTAYDTMATAVTAAGTNVVDLLQDCSYPVPSNASVFYVRDNGKKLTTSVSDSTRAMAYKLIKNDTEADSITKYTLKSGPALAGVVNSEDITTYFPDSMTLQDAVDAANPGETVKILKNPGSNPIMVSKNMTLDTNHFRIDMTGVTIDVADDITLTLSGGGNIDATMFNSLKDSEGSVVVHGGNFIDCDPTVLDSGLLAENSEYIAISYTKDGKSQYMVSDRAHTKVLAAPDTIYAPVYSNYSVTTVASNQLYAQLNNLTEGVMNTVCILPGHYVAPTTLAVQAPVEIVGLGDAADIQIEKTASNGSNRHLFNLTNRNTEGYDQMTLRNLHLIVSSNNTNKKGTTEDNAAVQVIGWTQGKCYDLIIEKTAGTLWGYFDRPGIYPFYVNSNNTGADGNKHLAYAYYENCVCINENGTIFDTNGTVTIWHQNLTYNNGENTYTGFTQKYQPYDEWEWDSSIDWSNCK